MAPPASAVAPSRGCHLATAFPASTWRHLPSVPCLPVVFQTHRPCLSDRFLGEFRPPPRTLGGSLGFVSAVPSTTVGTAVCVTMCVVVVEH